MFNGAALSYLFNEDVTTTLESCYVYDHIEFLMMEEMIATLSVASSESKFVFDKYLNAVQTL